MARNILPVVLILNIRTAGVHSLSVEEGFGSSSSSFSLPVLGIAFRVFRVIGRHSTTGVIPQPFSFYFVFEIGCGHCLSPKRLILLPLPPE
jgi:hypothetical protein